MLGAGVGLDGEIPHKAKRATAHHSPLHLASVGLCNSGTGKPTAPLKKREAVYSKGWPKAEQQDGMCLWSAWEGAAASSLDSPEQGESIRRNYVKNNVAKQEGSPTLKRSEK